MQRERASRLPKRRGGAKHSDSHQVLRLKKKPPLSRGLERERVAGLSGLHVDRLLLLASAGSLSGDLDLPRARILALRHLDLEKTVVELRADVLAINVVRQRERTDEVAVGPLHPVEVAALPLLLELPLAPDREDVALHLDVDLVLLEPGQLRGQENPVLVLGDVDRRH